MSRQFGIRELDPSTLYDTEMDAPGSPNSLSGQATPTPGNTGVTNAVTLNDLANILTQMQGMLIKQQETIQQQQQAIVNLQLAHPAPTPLTGTPFTTPATSFITVPTSTAPSLATAPSTNDALAPLIQTLKPKGNKPQEYHGRRENTKDFLSQCELYFRLNKMSEADKVSVAATYLRGSAFKWFGTHEKTYGEILTFDDFKTALTAAFGESDRAEKAKTQLANLRQTKSCAAYNSEFNRLVAEAGYTVADQTILIDVFNQGLKMDVRNLMLSLPIRTTLEATMNDAMICDNRIFNLQQQKRSKINLLLPRTQSSSFHNVTDTAVPMEIDSITTSPQLTTEGKLKQSEKDRRRREGLCLYDGKADCPGRDDVNLCPNLLKRKSKMQRPGPSTRR